MPRHVTFAGGPAVSAVLAVLLLTGCGRPQAELGPPTKLFADRYQDARTLFVEAARAAGCRMQSYTHPQRGPDGKPLFIDVALLGPANARSVLFVCSGTHGVEGFAGSAIQTGLLRDGLLNRRPRGSSVVLIHALNPHGFAGLRRANEDNVDLNRNFLPHGQRSYPKNDDYDRLADALAPADLTAESLRRADDAFKNYMQENGTVALRAAIETGTYVPLSNPAAEAEQRRKFVAVRGLRALQSVVSRGQYRHPKGLHYGGRGPAWSNLRLRSIVLAHGRRAERVVFLGLHTGLGAFGEGECILNEPETSGAMKRARAMWGDRAKTTVRGASVSPHLTGTVELAIPPLLPAATVTAASLEFGTLAPREVFEAMRAENWLHHHGGRDHPRAAELKMRLLRAFYPDSDDWKRRVWAQARQVVKQSFAGLKPGTDLRRPSTP